MSFEYAVGGNRGILQAQSANPQAPPAGYSRFFSRTLGDKVIPGVRGPAENIRLGRSPHGCLERGFNAQLSNNALLVFGGFPSVTAVGTFTAATYALTNTYTEMTKVESLVTVAATTAIAGWRLGTAMLSRQTGFYFATRFGFATGVSNASKRSFTGLRPTGTPTDVDPSSQVNIIGVGFDSADTNMQIMHNDGAGTATKIDLGSSFAEPTADRTAMYDFELYVAPGGSVVHYRVTDLVSGAVATGTISSDIPAATSILGVVGWLSVGGVSSVVGYAVSSVLVETEK